MNRRELLNEAWSIMWRNKSLLIIALLGTVGGLLLNVLVLFISPGLATSILNSLISIGLTAFVSGALIKMIDTIASGEEVSLNNGIQAGLQWLLPLFLISAILALPGWILSTVWTGSFSNGFSMLGQQTALQAANMLNYVGSMLGLGGLSLVIGVLAGAIEIGAQREAVLRNTGVFEALKRGWQLFREHFREYVSIAVLLFVIGLGIALISACAIVPMMNSLIANVERSGSAFNPATILSNPGYMVLLIVNLILDNLLAVLVSGIWTLAYRDWTENDRADEQPSTIAWN